MAINVAILYDPFGHMSQAWMDIVILSRYFWLDSVLSFCGSSEQYFDFLDQIHSSYTYIILSSSHVHIMWYKNSVKFINDRSFDFFCQINSTSSDEITFIHICPHVLAWTF